LQPDALPGGLSTYKKPAAGRLCTGLCALLRVFFPQNREALQCEIFLQDKRKSHGKAIACHGFLHGILGVAIRVIF
jgi:hypothetical protein